MNVLRKYLYFIILAFIIGILLFIGWVVNKNDDSKQKDKQQITIIDKELENNVISVESITPIWQFHNDDTKSIVGYLNPHVPIEYVSEKKDYYTISLQEGLFYIEKDFVITHEKVTVKDITTTSNTIDSIVPLKKDTLIYTEMDNNAQPFAKLLENMRYPILGQIDDWFVIRIGNRAGFVEASNVVKDKGIPVLVYHHVIPEAVLGKYKDASTTVTAEQFEEQMKFLVNNQFTILSKIEFLDYLSGHLILPKKSVLITFDDGLLSTKEYAYPVLKKYNIQALQHIISARKDRKEGFQKFDPEADLQYMTDEELAKTSDVFSFEAHTFNLHTLDPQTNKSKLINAVPGELRDDLRQNLEDIPSATTFSYPYGQYNEETIQILKEFNFKMAFTTKSGYAQIGDDPYTIKRLAPTQQTTVEDFSNLLNPH